MTTRDDLTTADLLGLTTEETMSLTTETIPARDLTIGDIVVTGPTPESRARVTDARLTTDGWVTVWLAPLTDDRAPFETRFDVAHGETVDIETTETPAPAPMRWVVTDDHTGTTVLSTDASDAVGWLADILDDDDTVRFGRFTLKRVAVCPTHGDIGMVCHACEYERLLLGVTD